MYDLNDIRSQVSLVALAEEAGAQFQHPHRLSSRCPLPRHAGDRSNPTAFHIYDQGKKWKCFSSCPEGANGGDIFTFYMAWQGVDFRTAVEALAERARAHPQQCITRTAPADQALPVTPAPQEPSPVWRSRAEQFIAWAQGNLIGGDGQAARAYLAQERGLWSESWEHFRLGYCPQNIYDAPERWGLEGKRVYLPRGIVIPGIWSGQPWYIKIRRPMKDDALGAYIGAWTEQDGLPEAKFGGPRGGHSALFGLEQSHVSPVLVLVEGEWDTMLVWQWCQDFCDVATLGGAQTHFNLLDLTVLARYIAVIVIHDSDQAGDRGRQYMAKIQQTTRRIQIMEPPAHDLSDYWKAGGNLRAWVAGHVATAMEDVLQGVKGAPKSYTIERWERIAAWARFETWNYI